MPSYDIDAPMSTMDWVYTHVLLIIPVVNIVCFFCWLLGMGNANRVTYIRGSILFVILFVALAFGASLLGISLESLGIS